MPAPPPDLSPAERAARFGVLFDATHRALLAYALRRVSDPADAADVVAETFLVAWRRLDDVPDGPDARPWLFGVARRVLANARRGERRRLALADRLRADLTDVVQPPEPVGDDVVRALGQLSDDDQELLRLVAWEELAHDQIAMVLGLSRGAVRVRLHRARRRLADRLAALATEPGEVAGPARVLAARTTPGHPSGWAPARPGDEEA